MHTGIDRQFKKIYTRTESRWKRRNRRKGKERMESEKSAIQQDIVLVCGYNGFGFYRKYTNEKWNTFPSGTSTRLHLQKVFLFYCWLPLATLFNQNMHINVQIICVPTKRARLIFSIFTTIIFCTFPSVSLGYFQIEFFFCPLSAPSIRH